MARGLPVGMRIKEPGVGWDSRSRRSARIAIGRSLTAKVGQEDFFLILNVRLQRMDCKSQPSLPIQKSGDDYPVRDSDPSFVDTVGSSP